MSGGADAADGVARVEAALRAHGIANRVERFPAGTATAAEADAAVGCEPGQIVKTLVFLAEGRAGSKAGPPSANWKCARGVPTSWLALP